MFSITFPKYELAAKKENPNATADDVLDDGWWSGLIIG